MLWDAYLSTVVTIRLPDGVVAVTATDGPPAGELPTSLGLPIHVVTAWNPGSRPLDRATNERRNLRLAADLDRRGAPWVHARGCSPDGAWCEDSLAVGGWRRDDACTLAGAYDQVAVFELWPRRFLVVASDLGRVEERASVVTLLPAA